LAQFPQKQGSAPVVFVCEHGNVKSLIASSLFDKAARERGLPFHSVSRGISPEAEVPLKIAEALRKDRIEVSDFKPQKLTNKDVADAARVIAIGVDLTGFETTSSVRIVPWDDVPPASVDYAASRAALLRHINALLTDLQASQGK
jgi:protein-tyrosine-phosphatase